ncbi:MAG: hypothetical protein JWP09_789 [Candidatus Taylorbacteria bacterium]|nr:hypothetical protein [Candidatus Taylorbacteria bacterium]
MKSILATLVAVMSLLLLTSCGKPVPQNKLALVVKTLGERSNDASATAEIYWARRLPFGASSMPSMRIYHFPLGIQDYSWTLAPCYESVKDEAFRINCLGGQLIMDINIQCYIDREDPDLAKKLLAFIGDFQMQGYQGESDMLAKWAGEKLPPFLRDPITQFSLSKQGIDVMRAKAEINKKVLDTMNARFNRYAIKFTTAGIISPIHPPNDQRKKMEEVVKKEYAAKALDLNKRELVPLLTSINQAEQDGSVRAQEARNRGTTEAIRLVAEAQQRRRTSFIKILGGPDNYILLEQMLTLGENLGVGETSFHIIPDSITYIGGNNSAVLPNKPPGNK